MEYKGYELFDDIQDAELQARNRAVVLWNIFESNSKKGRATPRGVVDMIEYAKNIKAEERSLMLEKFAEITSVKQGLPS